MSSDLRSFLIFFFFNDTATTEIYTLSLHDALPISRTTQYLPSFSLVEKPASDGILENRGYTCTDCETGEMRSIMSELV